MNYTIGQVAKMNHLSISKLRYYDNQGLFPFLKRTEKGDRVGYYLMFKKYRNANQGH